MLAAILKSPGCLELEEVQDPQCPKGGALLEVSACAVCGTDVKMRQMGHKDLAYPRILGHEIVGRIAEIDRDCGLDKGDLVQVWPGIACGKCRPCQREEDNRCQEMKILGFNQDGGFAEMLALPWQCISRGLNLLPKGTDPALAALAEPLACCINGQEMAAVCRGDRVLILGGGPIGSLHALLAEAAGAEKVIVVEQLQSRILQLKRHTNADVISADGNEAEFLDSLEKTIFSETEGARVDVVMLAAPQIHIDSRLFRLLAPGGRICIFSGPGPGNYSELMDLRTIHYRELTITGSYGCSSRQNRKAVELLSSGKIKANWVITKRARLEKINDALNHSADRSGMKSVVCGK
ncbi:MAG: alcohol dehydrogenase [Methanothrix sp.]|nr:MAG: alcohol dehydrogenase [Methanothrix sp.]